MIKLKMIMILCLSSIMIFSASTAFSKVITQFVPSFSITEEYTDNFNQTENNTEDEFSTIYAAGFTLGAIGQDAEMFLNYSPEYTDHRDFDENDAWRHDVSLAAQVQAARHTTLTFSQSWVRDLTRTVRTNTWEEHDTNETSIGMLYEFGDRDSLSLNYTYSFDNYENPNADEFKTHNPFASVAFWFTPEYGFKLDASYEKTEYDILTNEPETWFGSIRFLKRFTRHLNGYVSYAHTYTDEEAVDHTIYNPSIGFEWFPTEDSGISMGIGVLFQEWDYQTSDDDSQNFFLEFDIFKNWAFSRRGTLSVTGASGYTPTSDDAASLGFNIYYDIGARLTYSLTRRLTGDLSTAYEIDQFDEPQVDRTDNTLRAGAGLSWAPLQWLTLRLGYEFTDYETDDQTREDYQENVGMITIRMTPSRPSRFEMTNPRTELENQLFGN